METERLAGCCAFGLSQSVYYYSSRRGSDDEVMTALRELAEEHPGFGFWKLYYRLRNLGYPWNHK